MSEKPWSVLQPGGGYGLVRDGCADAEHTRVDGCVRLGDGEETAVATGTRTASHLTIATRRHRRPPSGTPSAQRPTRSASGAWFVKALPRCIRLAHLSTTRTGKSGACACANLCALRAGFGSLHGLTRSQPRHGGCVRPAPAGCVRRISLREKGERSRGAAGVLIPTDRRFRPPRRYVNQGYRYTFSSCGFACHSHWLRSIRVGEGGQWRRLSTAGLPNR